MSSSYIPQVGSNRLPFATWLTVSALSLLVMGLIIAAPVSASDGHSHLAQIIYGAFGHVCHQLPDRSFFIAGKQFAVCARCTGIYAGFLLAAWAYPLVRSLRNTETPDRKWLFTAATPLAIDFGLEFLGVWNNTHTSRLLTGAILGAASVFFILPGLLELSLRDWKRRERLPSVSPLASNASSAPSDYSAPHRRV